jgi:LacI family transcriptional regulator
LGLLSAWEAGLRPPRLKDVAAAAGVHPATASRALNEHTVGLLSPETAERVRQAADRLGYRVNRMARGLKTRRSFAIGMLIPDITNPFFPPIVKGAEDALAHAGYTLVLANTDNDEAKERLQLSGMLQSQVDGLIIATARRRGAAVEQLRSGPVPMVLVNRTIDRGGVSAVIPDDLGSMGLAVRHLHELGHRRIGHVGGPQDTSTGSRRAKGFAAVMHELGLPAGRMVRANLFNEEEGRLAAAVLLEREPTLTAIVAANDLLALGTLDAASEAGLRCPDDLSIMGMNDMPLSDRIQPPLSTVRVGEYELGRQAARVLLSHIESPGRRPETILIAPELIVRESTAKPASNRRRVAASKRRAPRPDPRPARRTPKRGRDAGPQPGEPAARGRDIGPHHRDPADRDREPTARGREPTAPDRDPTAQDREPTARGREPTARDREPTARDQEPTAPDRDPTAQDREPTARGREPTAPDREPEPRHREPTGPDGEPKARDLDAQRDPERALKDPEASALHG